MDTTYLFGNVTDNSTVTRLRRDFSNFTETQVTALISIEEAGLASIERKMKSADQDGRTNMAAEMMSHIQLVADHFATPTSHDDRYRATMDAGYSALKFADTVSQYPLIADFHASVLLVAGPLALRFREREAAIRSAAAGAVLGAVMEHFSSPLGRGDLERLLTPYYRAVDTQSERGWVAP